jgi:hypothetical protein
VFKRLALAGKLRNGQQLSAEQRQRDIKALADALAVRFDQVQVAGDEVSAFTSRNAFFFRGPRNHPMLPFGAARFWFVDAAGQTELRYQLSIVGQVMLVTAGWAVFTMSFAMKYGLANAARRSAGLLLGLFVLNTVIELVRTRRWLRSVLN